VFLTFKILALILAFIRPSLYANSMLYIFIPLTLVNSAVNAFKNTVTMGFIIEPLPFVDVSIRVNQSADPICFIVVPLAFID